MFLDSLCAGRYSLKEVFGGEFRSVFGDEGEGVQSGFWMHGLCSFALSLLLLS